MLWEEGPWGQLGVPYSLCKPQSGQGKCTDCHGPRIPGNKTRVCPAPTGPALVTPKVRGSPLPGKPDARPFLPSTRPRPLQPSLPARGPHPQFQGARRRPRAPRPVPKRPENQGLRVPGALGPRGCGHSSRKSTTSSSHHPHRTQGQSESPLARQAPCHPGVRPRVLPRCAGRGPLWQRRAWDSPHAP